MIAYTMSPNQHTLSRSKKKWRKISMGYFIMNKEDIYNFCYIKAYNTASQFKLK
jgi:hypothetical protein